jgi:hypothetical protein
VVAAIVQNAGARGRVCLSGDPRPGVSGAVTMIHRAGCALEGCLERSPRPAGPAVVSLSRARRPRQMGRAPLSRGLWPGGDSGECPGARPAVCGMTARSRVRRARPSRLATALCRTPRFPRAEVRSARQPGTPGAPHLLVQGPVPVSDPDWLLEHGLRDPACACSISLSANGPPMQQPMTRNLPTPGLLRSAS